MSLLSVRPPQFGYLAKVRHYRLYSTRIPISDEGGLDTDIPSESFSSLKPVGVGGVVGYKYLMRFPVQYQDEINIGCDPDGYPTNDFIQRYASVESRGSSFETYILP